MPQEIMQCPSCEGYGWIDDAESEDCDWCGGIGYVYRADGVTQRIPPADFEAVADTLEALESERLRGMGYTGTAKKPWEQAIRRHDDADDSE
jgi:DnaJ-class molecular chaperone